MDHILFRMADFLSRPPGFYFVIAAMVVSTALVPFGFTGVVTYALSVAAIVITSIVLIQGYRDTTAIHAKLDEIIVSMRETRNDAVGLEHEQPEHIEATVARLEAEADKQPRAGREATTP
ncbi:low affinity iron permease family protein [Sinorhizobium garamanticum]|uniref:Low affinity iron permease family protein n=1 Tax=Sinorhizobium garamanticum TaxID=680247 RepID=A0ABY8DJV9_9HYPH|nr:low affinity iron permease family protein [Sinorhizobium garamanticum]WEX89972.1 low affinity iron permease family protein [Sinorhizobium garamanticum]